MNLAQMIKDLREEKACLDEVIISLVRLAQKREPKRGRPPLWMRPTLITEPKKLNRRNGSNGRRHSASASAAS